MNLAEQRRFAIEFQRWYKRHQRFAFRLVRSWLSGIADSVLAMLEKLGIEATLANFGDLIQITSIRELLNRIYRHTLPEAAQREFDRLKDLIPKRPGVDIVTQAGFFSRTWQNTIGQMLASSQTAQRVTQIAESTRNAIRRVLVQANAENVDVRTAASRLRTLLTGKGSRTRALMIARTETTRAAAAGHEAGAMSTTLQLEKKWIPAIDSRTRHDHAVMARSKPVPRDDYFIVGGVRMKYPGDPAGGPSQVINCRCIQVYVPVTHKLSRST